MNRPQFTSCGMITAGLLLAGCVSSTHVAAPSRTTMPRPSVRVTTGTSYGVVDLCANCGQIKGTALCCRPGQTVCAKCMKFKGSPGCCKAPPGLAKKGGVPPGLAEEGKDPPGHEKKAKVGRGRGQASKGR